MADEASLQQGHPAKHRHHNWHTGVPAVVAADKSSGFMWHLLQHVNMVWLVGVLYHLHFLRLVWSWCCRPCPWSHENSQIDFGAEGSRTCGVDGHGLNVFSPVQVLSYFHTQVGMMVTVLELCTKNGVLRSDRVFLPCYGEHGALFWAIRTLHDCPSQMNENLLISNSKLTSDSELIWWC